MAPSDREGKIPSMFSIFHGEVASLQAYGAFVKIPGCKKQGLVHKSQMSSARVEDPSEMLAKGEKVYCKVIAMEGEGEKISLSMKVVNQTTGQDMDPNNVQLDQDSKKRRQWQHIGKNKIELGAELNTTCRKCGGHGHLTMDCFASKDGTQYDLIPDIETLTELPPISELIEAQHQKKKKKKKKEKKEKKKKAKKRKHHSSSSASSSSDDDQRGDKQRDPHRDKCQRASEEENEDRSSSRGNSFNKQGRFHHNKLDIEKHGRDSSSDTFDSSPSHGYRRRGDVDMDSKRNKDSPKYRGSRSRDKKGLEKRHNCHRKDHSSSNESESDLSPDHRRQDGQYKGRDGRDVEKQISKHSSSHKTGDVSGSQSGCRDRKIDKHNKDRARRDRDEGNEHMTRKRDRSRSLDRSKENFVRVGDGKRRHRSRSISRGRERDGGHKKHRRRSRSSS